MPVDTIHGYELILMQAQKIPPTINKILNSRGESTKINEPKMTNSPSTPIKMILFLPNFAPSQPLGNANNRKANEKKVNEKEA
ncbi:hypothetical protein D3C78_1368490 [compost metagenome]